MPESLRERLAAAERAGLRRPWEIIFDRAPARDFTTGESIGVMAPILASMRIVDADSRLIARFQADPEQAMTLEDMALIVEAINAL